MPAPPALRLPSAQVLATGQHWLNRPGVSDLLSTIEELRDAPDDVIEIDWSQYRGFYSTHDEFRTSLLAAFDEFANGIDAERPFDQVGELHTRRPEPMPKAEVDGAQPKPVRVTHPSILDHEWATWLLGILAAAAGLGTWLLTKSIIAGVGAFLLVAVSSTLAVFALERRWRSPKT